MILSTRIEFFLVGGWNVGMFLKISLLLYLTTISLVQVFGLEKRKVLIFPMVAVVLVYLYCVGNRCS